MSAQMRQRPQKRPLSDEYGKDRAVISLMMQPTKQVQLTCDWRSQRDREKAY